MFKTTLLPTAALAGFLALPSSTELPENMHKWLLEMHSAQIKLLKINWGQPGLCTEWDRDYEPQNGSCGKRGKLIKRRYSQ